MSSFVVAGRAFDLRRETVEAAVRDVLPEPLDEHYVVVAGRRYPPKQVLARARPGSTAPISRRTTHDGSCDVSASRPHVSATWKP